MKKTIEELKKDLLDIMPFGTKINDDVIHDMPQFIQEYMYHMKGRMAEKYPHRKDLIKNAYDFIITDSRNESVFEE